MKRFDYDVVVVGAGVVGLAVARQLVRRFPSLIVLERHDSFGEEVSSRSSEVIHGGLYYPPGSIKARTSARGRELLYGLADQGAIGVRRTGKLVVAVDDAEAADLGPLCERAHANGGLDARIIDGAEARRLEPAVRGVAALLSPATGIVDSHGLMRHLVAEARDRGADTAFRATLVAVDPEPGGFALRVRDPQGEETALRTRILINAAGLDADRVAGMAGIDTAAAGYHQHWVKGSFFRYRGPDLRVTRLVYPVPHQGKPGLGIHLVVDLAGGIRFGPDTRYLPDRVLDYTVDPHLGPSFAAAVRPFLPSVAAEHLVPDYAGVRPKLTAAGEATRDYIVCHEVERGLAGLVNLIGIDSPGLTAALGLAEAVDELLADLA